MNFTYYFYCEDEECGFRQTIHQYGEEVTLQCKRCFKIEAKATEQVYHLACVACGKKKHLQGEVAFDPRYNETCTSCGLSGEIGFEKGGNVLLVLGSEMKTTAPCTNCKQNEWVELIDTNFTCPHCFQSLKQKLSMVWEEDKQADS